MPGREIFNAVVGTAGHIDHGKSSLVKRLTGTNPDRFKEELERGVTIDIGFAEWTLPDGREVGLVDVPGHEKFVKNMVAAATGIDFVILVVAADDGVMPQTREHLQIMQLLGIDRGMVAVTKIDMVDPDYLELMLEEIEQELEGTFLGGAKMVAFDSISGNGFDAFEAELVTQIEALPVHPTDGLFRMPIQRVFSARGHGTIVTGIPVSGTINKGDQVEVLPGARAGRVRSIQVYGEGADSACAGHRTAINVTDVPYDEVSRGMVIASPGYFEPHKIFEAELTYTGRRDSSEAAHKPLLHNQPIHFHTGTSEVTGRVFLLEGSTMPAGTTGLVQIQLDEPVVAAPGDRFVIRRYSPVITIGGGKVVGVAERRGGRRAEVADRVRQKAETLGDVDQQAAVLVREAGPSGTTESELKKALQLKPAEARDLVARLLDGTAEKLKGSRLVHLETLSSFRERLVVKLDEFHVENPRQQYCVANDLRNSLGLSADPHRNETFNRVLGQVIEAGDIVRDPRDIKNVCRKGHEAQLSAAEKELYESLCIIYRDGNFSTPRPEQAAEKLDTTMAKLDPVLALALERHDLIQLDDKANAIVERGNFERAVKIVIRQCADHGEVITGELRDELETSRKFLIPFGDYLDKIGVTVRNESNRTLRSNYAAALQRELNITLE